MKNLFCLILSMLFVLALLPACGPTAPGETTAEPTEAPKPHTLSVGFGRADITPTESVPLDGLNDTLSRWSEEVKDPLYASCAAFTDENGNTILHFSLDLQNAHAATVYGKSDVSKATGVPFNNIMIGSTHNHSCPAVGYTNQPAIERYNEFLRQKMVEAASQAMADRKPATMHITTTYPENINFIRHYVMSDGSYAGDNFGSFGGGRTIVGHVRKVDNALQLVKFVREGGKDVIMMNWQGHPTGHGDHRYSVLSFFTRVINAVETGLDCHCIYILGASGNVNNSSKIPEEKIYKTYEEKAAALAKYAVDAKEYQQVETGNVQILAQTVGCTPKDGSTIKVDVTLNAFSIGDVALVTAPYEMYCENGEAIKENSPFKMTLVSSCSNSAHSYIPSISTYDYNNMPDEVYGIMKTHFAPGTAEILQDTFVSMLNELHKTN